MKKESSFFCKRTFFYFIKGVLIGFADLVPGISGGTIAFILGIYKKLLLNLKSIDKKAIYYLITFRFSFLRKKIDFGFLFSVFLGILLAIFSFAHLFSYLLKNVFSRPLLFSFFIGAMVSATLMIIKKIEKWQKKMFFFFLLGFFLGGSMMYFKSPEKKTFSVHFPKYSYLYTKDLKNYDESYFLKDLSKKDLLVLYKNGFIDKSTKIIDKNLNSFLFSDVFMTLKASIFDPFLIFAGCLAICAMMLPGVSGSYVLLLLGVYSSSLHAVVDLCKTIGEGSIAIDSLFYIINLSIGCVIGLAVFSRFLLWLLKNYEQMVLATITGLMTSSLYALWPFLSFYKVLDPIKGKVDFSFVSPVLPKVFSYSFFLSLLCFFIGVIFFNLLIYKSKKQELINI